jgi:hypothetical protein
MKDEGEAMKIFFVFLLLLIGLMAFIIMLDLIMGTNFNQALPNLRKPFEVSEPAEYFIFFVLLVFPIIKTFVVYLINKKTKTSSEN